MVPAYSIVSSILRRTRAGDLYVQSLLLKVGDVGLAG